MGATQQEPAAGKKSGMRILVDVTHPAHVHFFARLFPALRERGHEVFVTSRDKDVTLPLLEALGVEHKCLSTAGRTKWRLLIEMLARLGRLRGVIKQIRPAVILAREGLYASQAGWLTGVPAISFDDTDDATIQQRLYFPFAWRVYTDRAYGRSIGRKQRFFNGVSCLAYLHPRVFQPDPSVRARAGLEPEEQLILCRLVSWTSNHDYGEHGFDSRQIRPLLMQLAEFGRVMVSTEVDLPGELVPYRINLPPHDLHHLMAQCVLFVGESPTMATECAVLGVPAVHVSSRKLWYTDLLEKDFQLVRNVDNARDCLEAARASLMDPEALARHRQRRDRYLSGTDDLESVVLSALEEVPALSGDLLPLSD